MNQKLKKKIYKRILNITQKYFEMNFFKRKDHRGLNISELCNSIIHVFFTYTIMIVICSQN